uniref:Transmembrane protein 163 n=1 Tax=Pavo cristatus TaxID=9049 RepID=A0A8C9G3D9_PAVCR
MEPPAAALDSTPDPAIVQPPRSSPPVPPREQQQQQEQLRIGESGQFGEGPEDRGLLESSTRLKPHEAQSYRKKALWVSWVSIIVTLALAVAAFSEYWEYFKSSHLFLFLFSFFCCIFFLLFFWVLRISQNLYGSFLMFLCFATAEKISL